MAEEIEKPAAGYDRGGPSKIISRQRLSKDSRKRTRAQHKLTFRLTADGQPITVYGREAQTLRLLITAGSQGITSGEASPLGWARRTSHYVYKLRGLGLPIITVMEDAGDARVGRYSLTCPVFSVQDAAP